MADKREQVFVSSTFKDLVDERAAVIQTLLQADCMPSGMEMFPASDSEKFDLIKGVIDLCDYYVVIIGGRYGSMDDQQQLSYTEMEYDYAVKVNKPVMAFLHGDPGKIIGEKLDLDAALRTKLDNFRSKAETRMVKYWHETGDLSGQVALAIMQIRKSHPAEGWIRAGEAMTPEVKAELAELRAKVRELQSDLKDEQRQRDSVEDLAELVQGDEITRIDCTIWFHYQDTIEAGKAFEGSRLRARWAIRPSWNRVFRHLGPELMDEATEGHLIERLSDLCLEMSQEDLVHPAAADVSSTDVTGDHTDDDSAGDDGSADDDEDGKDRPVGDVYRAEVEIESFNDVKVQLFALRLIDKGVKRRSASDTSTYWRLTDRGGEQLLRLRAIRRSPTGVGPGDD